MAELVDIIDKLCLDFHGLKFLILSDGDFDRLIGLFPWQLLSLVFLDELEITEHLELPFEEVGTHIVHYCLLCAGGTEHFLG
jgi:hypothetical protein